MVNSDLKDLLAQGIEAKRRGFSGIWLVHPPHRIVNEMLVGGPLDESSVAQLTSIGSEPELSVVDRAVRTLQIWNDAGGYWYVPMAPESKSLVTEIAKLAEPTSRSVVQFANYWGLLGFEQLSHWQGIPDARMTPIAIPNKEFHEPLRWIGAHARTISLCLQIVDLWLDGDIESMSTLLESQLPDRKDSKLGFKVAVETQSDKTLWIDSPESQDQVIGAALSLAIETINENIKSMKPLFWESSGGNRFEAGYAWNALIQIAYWRLGELASEPKKGARAGLKRCGYCRSFFPASHGRQIYCPPPPGKSRSLCSGRIRSRKFRSAKGNT